MKLLILDTETTGIPTRDPLSRIVEVAGVIAEWDGSSVVLGATFETLCNPGAIYWDRVGAAKALEICHLTGTDIEQAPPAYRAGDLLRRWIQEHKPDAMTSYGTEFDFDPMLLGAPEWLECFQYRIPLAPCLRTLAMESRGLTQYQKGYQLNDLLAIHGIPRVGAAHSALSDAIGCAALLPHIFPADWTPTRPSGFAPSALVTRSMLLPPPAPAHP